MADIPLKSFTFPGLSDKYTTPVVDNTLTVAGAAADAKKTGDELDGLKNDLNQKADKADALSAYVVETETGSIASFSDGADDVPVKDLTVAIEPVQSGSGDPSPENIRPISGWTGANVTACGKNLFNHDAVTVVDAKDNDYCGIKYENRIGAFTISASHVTSGYIYLLVRRQDGTYESDRLLSNVTYHNYTINVSKGDTFWIVDVGTHGASGISTAKGHLLEAEVQVEIGSAKTEYVPFNGSSVSINWQTEAGTVYGGTLDVTTGVLTVTNGYVNLGALNWTYISGNNSRMAATLTGVKPATMNIVCSKYITDTVSHIYTHTTDKTIGIHGTNAEVWVYDSSYTDASDFKTANNETQLAYELATPQTYQLTPEEVKTILGQNNIFADTGDVTVQYRADTKLYIDKVLNA